MSKIKKGDTVMVITGKDKRRVGTVLKVLALKVWVQGVNLVKKCVKADPNKNQPGGIIQKEMPLDISNLSLVSSSNKPEKVIFKFEEGKKVRFFKKTGERVDV